MHVLASMVVFGLLVYCVVDIALRERSEIRAMPKTVWLLVVLLIPVFGSLAWLVVGRPAHAGLAPGSTSGGGPRAPRQVGPRGSGGAGGRRVGPSTPRPRGPEDDPEFLRKLDDQLRRDRRDDAGGDR